MHEFGTHGWGLGWGWIIGVLLLAILVWIIVKAYSSKKRGKPDNSSPLDILKERYARGEIDKDEFERRKKELS